jgi:hypothetical protein
MATVQQRIVAALLSFRLSPNLSLHTLRAPFIHSFMQPHPTPHHHIIASPGLVLPCLALSVPHKDSSSSCCPPDNDDNSDPDVHQQQQQQQQQQQHFFLLFLSRIESILL